MSGHSRWERPETMKLPMDEHMAQYVQGYIMAMEDVLRAIEILQYAAEEAGPEYSDGHADALESMKHEAEESRESARRTLDMIVKKLEATQ